MRPPSSPPPDVFDDPRRARAAQLATAVDDIRDPIARRDFLARMGAAMALAGVGACTRAPRTDIVPYVVQPPEVTPGRPRYYATSFTLDGYATGILVESHEGRPTKVEGNPGHPASLGAATAFQQASVLSLYDPSRARLVQRRGSVTTWEDVHDALTQGPWRQRRGRGLHFLLEPTSSPAVGSLLDALRSRLPEATVTFYAPASPRNAWEGARIAFGRVLEPRFDLTRADVVVALDSDLLARGPASLRLSRDLADRRGQALTERADTMIRLYSVETLRSVTGAYADHRLPARPEEIVAIAAALAREVGVAAVPGGIPSELSAAAAPYQRWVAAVARDLRARHGRSAILVGDEQPPVVHALAHAMNDALGNVGAAVTFAPSPILEAGEPSHDLGRLEQALDAGDIDTLVVCGTNPVYASSAGRALASRFGRARQSAYLGLHVDETAVATTFMIPRTHPFESWGDARAYDGTLSVVQPLIDPLTNGHSELEVLGMFLEAPQPTDYERVRSGYRSRFAKDASPKDFEKAWRGALKRGLVPGTAFAPVSVRLDGAAIAAELARTNTAPRPGLDLVLRLDPMVHDGRFASNAWLLELPSPMEKLTWMNAAMLSPKTAKELGVTTGDELDLRANGAGAKAPACVVPGQADGTIALRLGWGRDAPVLARGRGTDAYPLASASLFAPVAVHVAKTGKRREMPFTQKHHDLEGRDRDILQHASFEEYRSSPRFRERTHKRALSLYENRPPSDRYQWGMAIDLARCTGCSACVVACQAENNSPTVGFDGVMMNRAMHWLRIDTYHLGDPDDPDVAVQPMLCQHCEKAPCEYVCPVNATVHSDDGLNEMVYNRCVGTRFCSNNCPYKVRRFNWFNYHRETSPGEALVFNPDVTVRTRGVMEKCTFCVQRLREHGIKKERGEAVEPVQTACQQTCPTRAIVFGNLLDESSEVVAMHRSDRTFAALFELGTEPRVRYLARIRNPNPELS